MTDAIDISVGDHKLVLGLLKQHLPNVAVWAYGSRVKWTARPQSDLDLVAFPSCEQKAAGFNLREALEESSLPFPVDLFIWDELPESFRKRIEAEHVVLVEKEELGMVGDGWGSLRLGDVCTKIGSGATPRGGQEVYLKDGPYALIRSQNVHNNRFNYDGLAFINQQQATALDNVEVFADDALLNITGDSVARACQVASNVLPARVNQHVAIIRPDPDKLSPRFLRYFLVCPEIQAMLLSWAGAGGTRNALTKGMIESLDVQAPMDVAEQRAIAHILGTLDDKIELNRRMNETLEEMARALFKSWFVDFDPVRAKMEGRDTGLPPDVADLFPDRLVESELGEIPEGWEVRPLANCFNLTMGQSPPGSTYNDDGDGLPFFQGCSDFGFRYPENRRFCTAPTRIAHSDDTLVSVRAPVGEINMAWEKCCIGRGVAALRHKSGSSSFTYYATQVLQPQLRQYEETGTVFGSINRKQFETLPVLAPKAELLDCFETYMLPLEQRIRVNVSESRTLAVLRDALLPKLVSGELRVVESMGREGLYHYS